ncbi:MAG: N6-adenine-specific DNA methylase [Proteobacteria bacterium SG_bin7]|nr:MAG: N6-adenine-specific DNA methylase [Proteobacteria bacterium SG_bin7]
MAKFFAHGPEGLVDVVYKELQELELNPIEKTPGGVVFDTDWRGCYKANLWLRSATRVGMPIISFKAKTAEILYQEIRKFDFTQFVSNQQTIMVDALVKKSEVFRDQRFAALKIKDAIVDQFRDKFGERPNVEKENPDLRILARILEEDVQISIDTSGEPLFMRGYRREMTEAPLKENLAAGLVLLTKWDQKTNIIDPMCGSGTFLIEAALMAARIAPGLLRRGFAFQKYLNFSAADWNELVNEASEAERETDVKFFGFDRDSKAISISESNAKRAGVSDFIHFERKDSRDFEPPKEMGSEKGVIMVNPPYGERLGNFEQLKDVYRDLGFVLKSKFKNWDIWVLSGHAGLTNGLSLKSSENFNVHNGPIECRWLKFHVNK